MLWNENQNLILLWNELTVIVYSIMCQHSSIINQDLNSCLNKMSACIDYHGEEGTNDSHL